MKILILTYEHQGKNTGSCFKKSTSRQLPLPDISLCLKADDNDLFKNIWMFLKQLVVQAFLVDEY